MEGRMEQKMLGRIIGIQAFIVGICVILVICSNIAFALNCQEQKQVCIEAGGEKEINGIKVYRDCWKYKYQKICNVPSKNNCNSIDANNCSLVEEKCALPANEEGVSFCANTERDFSCKRRVTYDEESTDLKQDPGNALSNKDLLCKAYCLDGNCPEAFRASSEANDEMGSAIGQLSALAKIKEGLIDANGPNFDVFKANTRNCSEKMLNYTNCCKMGGWAKSIGIASCSKDDHQLAELKSKNKCEYVGSYCTSKVPLLGCAVEKHVYCCFDSLLSKAIHKEGRKQLGRNLGSAEHPSCRGFTLEELGKVDFSKVNYDEFFSKEVLPKINTFNQQDLNNKIQSSIPKMNDSKIPSKKSGMNEEMLNKYKDTGL
jgi:conjugal transfer mating pair stabilization protein TraN